MISIIIVNFNTKELISSCLDSIPNGVEDLSYEIIVVDNGSCDGSTLMLKERYPHVRLVENESNLGFSRANNIGARIARGEVFLFLNSDTLVKKQSILILYRILMGAADIGIVGPKILNVEGLPTRSYMRFLTLPMLFAGSSLLSPFLDVEQYRMHFSHYDFTQARPVPWLSGACLMAKRNVFLEIGGFDEGYFFYCEDMDFCLQAHRRGYRTIFEPAAEIVHLFGGSSGKKERELIQVYRQSVFHYFYKNFSPFHAWMAKLLLFIRGR